MIDQVIQKFFLSQVAHVHHAALFGHFLGLIYLSLDVYVGAMHTHRNRKIQGGVGPRLGKLALCSKRAVSEVPWWPLMWKC